MGPMSSKVAAWREQWDQALRDAESEQLMDIPVEPGFPLGGLSKDEYEERFEYQMKVFDLNKVGFLDQFGHRRYTNKEDFGYVTEENFKSALSRIAHINPPLTDSGRDVRLLNDLVQELPHEFRPVPGYSGGKKIEKEIEYVVWQDWVDRCYELTDLFNRYRRGESPRSLRDEGYSVEQFISAGLRRYLHEAGFPVDEVGGTDKYRWDRTNGLNNSFELKRAGYILTELRKDAGITIVEGRPLHTKANDILSNPEGTEVLGGFIVPLSAVQHIEGRMKGVSLPLDFLEEADEETQTLQSAEGAEDAQSTGDVTEGSSSVTQANELQSPERGIEPEAKDDSSSVADSAASSSSVPKRKRKKKVVSERIIPEGVQSYALETIDPMHRDATGSVFLQHSISSRTMDVIESATTKTGTKVRKKPIQKTVYTVWLQVLAAEDLLAAPINTGDPYLTAELVDAATGEPLEGTLRKLRTKTAVDTTNPIWNEGVVEWAEVYEDVALLAVKIKVLDADMLSLDLRRLQIAGYTTMELKKDAKFLSCHFRAGKFPLKEIVQAGIFGVGGCTKLRLAGFSIEELKEEFTVGQLRLAGFSPMEITNAGFTLEMIKLSNTTTVVELKAAGYTATEMRRAHYTALQMIGANYTVPEMKLAGYTAAQLRYAKYPVAELVAAGFTAVELKRSGCSAYDLNLVGFTAVELRAAGYLAKELAVSRYPVEQIKAAGYNALEMKQANLTAKELKDLSFSATELAGAGFTLLQLKKVDYTTKNLFDAGFHPRLLREVGFSLELVREGSGWETANLLHNQAGFTGQELYKSGYSAKAMLEAKCSVRYIKASGWHSGQLREAGTPLEELVAARFTAPQLVRDAHYDDPLELKDQGYK